MGNVGTATGRDGSLLRRRARHLCAALLACAALTAACGPPAASATTIGLNEGGPDLITVGQSGADLYRVTFRWQRVTEKGNWHEPAAWEASLDPIVAAGAKHGYSILGLLAERDQPGPKLRWFYLKAEEPGWSEYQQFVEMAVERYGRGGQFWESHPGLPYRPITVWEVWNEPNQAVYTPNGVPSPQQYAEFLVETSETITSAQLETRKPGEPSDTVILHGGLLSTHTGSAGHMKVQPFVEQAAAAVPAYATSFDGFGLHPYAQLGSAAESRPEREEKRLQRFKEYVNEGRSALQAIGSVKPIWITELGWPAATTGTIPGSEAEQQSLLSGSFQWVKGRSDVAEVTWFNYQDNGLSGWEGVAGLRRGNSSFRPSWLAFRAQAGATGPWPGGRMAFQANSSALVTNFSLEGGEPTGQGLASGTSPSIARLPTGGYQTAFQANNSQLYTWGPAGYGSLGQGMAPGTSPSIAGLTPKGNQIAFQANTSALITMGTAGNVNTGLGMAAGTSPSITGLGGGGYQIAIQANTSQLWTTGSLGTTNWGLGMAAGTSPAITYLTTGGYQVAFQANNSQLWTVGTAGNTNTGLGVAPGTSPSIAALSTGGYEVAFQSNAGQLWTIGTAGWQNWGQGMAPGTSPSIAPLPNGGYQVAFQSNAGQLITLGTGIAEITEQGMAKGTSPDIAPE